jgi:GTPase SAR1 family protein
MSDYVKIITLGASTVGKTSLMYSYIGTPVRANHITTIGLDFMDTTTTIGAVEYAVKMFDTAG